MLLQARVSGFCRRGQADIYMLPKVAHTVRYLEPAGWPPGQTHVLLQARVSGLLQEGAGRRISLILQVQGPSSKGKTSG